MMSEFHGLGMFPKAAFHSPVYLHLKVKAAVYKNPLQEHVIRFLVQKLVAQEPIFHWTGPFATQQSR